MHKDIEIQAEMESSFLERRKDTSQLLPYAAVECHCTLDPSGLIFDGLVVNISESGICINTLKSLNRGHKIYFKSNDHRFCRTAVVRWIENVTPVFFRIGLEFTEC